MKMVAAAKLRRAQDQAERVALRADEPCHLWRLAEMQSCLARRHGSMKPI